MTCKLVLSNKNFKAVIKMLQAIMYTLETNDNLSKEIEELNGSLQLKISILLPRKSLIFFSLVSSIQLFNN